MSKPDPSILVVLLEPELRDYVQKFTRQSAVDNVVQWALSATRQRVQRGADGDLLGFVYGAAREIALSEALYIRCPSADI